MKRPETEARDTGATTFEKEMSELLHEQIFFTESVFAHLPMGIEIYDTTGILRSINKRAQAMYGVEPQTVINKVNLFESPYVDDELLARIKSGEEIVLEFEYDFERMNREYFATRNRNTIIYEAKVVAIRNKGGNIVGHMLLTNDVTATKEAEYRTEETKKNLEMAMETANMSSWVYDVHKRSFTSLHGTPVVENVMSMDEMMQILHPQDKIAVTELFNSLVEKHIQRGQITVRIFNKRDGAYRHYESRMRLSTQNRGKVQIIGTRLDVTDRIRMEKNTKDLLAKRELAMKVNDIVHWDFDVRKREFESYNDPVNDYASDSGRVPERHTSGRPLCGQ